MKQRPARIRSPGAKEERTKPRKSIWEPAREYLNTGIPLGWNAVQVACYGMQKLQEVWELSAPAAKASLPFTFRSMDGRGLIG